jgi:hypothetical protein
MSTDENPCKSPQAIERLGTVGCTSYLNTDLDLTSPGDLTALAATFEVGGASALAVHAPQSENEPWSAHFEPDEQYTEPEQSIAAMLTIVESLPEDLRRVWTGCTERNFDIGYDCGSEPRAFNHGLSNQLLGRIAATGASVRITLYACRARD